MKNCGIKHNFFENSLLTQVHYFYNFIHSKIHILVIKITDFLNIIKI